MQSFANSHDFQVFILISSGCSSYVITFASANLRYSSIGDVFTSIRHVFVTFPWSVRQGSGHALHTVQQGCDRSAHSVWMCSRVSRFYLTLFVASDLIQWFRICSSCYSMSGGRKCVICNSVAQTSLPSPQYPAQMFLSPNLTPEHLNAGECHCMLFSKKLCTLYGMLRMGHKVVYSLLHL